MIGIVGYGFVGQALGSVLTDPFIVVDPNHPEGVGLQVLMDHSPEIIFICVPTPEVELGLCDDSLVLGYVHELRNWKGTLVIKSTIPPDTVKDIEVTRPGTVIWPELLREDTAFEDMRFPSLIVLGCSDKEVSYGVERFILSRTKISTMSLDDPEHGVVRTIRHVSPTEASIFKYTVNAFLATKVVFMHQMFLWMRARGEESSWDTISDLLQDEGRIGPSHLRAPGKHGFGFAGSCFPKDTEALIWQVISDKSELPLLAAAMTQNARLRKIK